MLARVKLGVICALAAAALYGLIPNFVRAAFNHGVPSVEATLFRTTVIAVAFGLIAAVQGERFYIPPAARLSFAGQAASTLVISVAYLASVQFVPVGLAVIIFFSFPVLIVLIAPLVERQRLKAWRVGVALAAFFGLVVAIGPSFDSLDLRGVGLALLAALGGVMQFLTGRAMSRHLKPAVFGALVHAAIWPFTLAVALLVGGGKLAMFSGTAEAHTALIFLAGVAAVYVVAYMLQMLSLRFAPAVTVAPFYNLEPVVTTLCAAWLFGERLSSNQYAGGGIVLAVLVLSSFLSSRETMA
jgi:drug/metabolite transporter (DMT)-like permease